MRKISIAVVSLFTVNAAFAQQELPMPDGTPLSYNPAITTGVSFLTITPDARSGALGDMGVATSADAFSQFYNPAKYAFAEKQQGFALSYTPYMSKIASDISLMGVSYYNRVNERSAIGTSLRYFTLGEINLTNNQGEFQGVEKPNEFSVDVSYTIKFSDNFGMAVAGRYISSNLRLRGDGETAANTFAVDVAGYYESDRIQMSNSEGRLRAGFNFQNMGPKVSYTGDTNFASNIPTTLRLGVGYDYILDNYNTVTFYGETTKLMVPSNLQPTFTDANGNGEYDAGEDVNSRFQEYRDIGWFSGMFKSFGDAPGGFGEEMREFTWSLGAEYWYQNSFAFRLGYFNEAEDKGARKFATLGAGFKYNIVNIDVSYLLATGKVQNPLENTLRFSLTFNFGRDYYKN
ncbi:type IX secretion system outer membrane channel protein PorV [Flavobacterium sp. CBA20B-1]|uniref:type IX secretion system outer membrane channel protein PorV n=1 Tax=unclassified Flavobacterium TaxID=196869 RepID=UPI0022254EF5|nr:MULTISPECIES: type IX secretion system outer membrane channel protein PorV [unclassified Flavobacterium]WCM41980.1 type IX secretion system outer membrane channel protein PorV [Flavobacterium sp. CBA20B-1]